MIHLSCPKRGVSAKASSVLNKNIKLYGPMNALDTSNESSCWNSDGDNDDGSTANSDLKTFIINFPSLVLIQQLKIQFQGGFVSEELSLFTCRRGGDDVSKQQQVVKCNEWVELQDLDVEPEDNNEMQTFNIGDEGGGENNFRICDSLKIGFKSSTDFYGRIIVYKLEVWGDEIK